MKKLNQTELKIITKRILQDLREAAKAAQKELDTKTLKERTERAKQISSVMRDANKELINFYKQIEKKTNGYCKPPKAIYDQETTKVSRIADGLKEKQTLIEVPGHRYSDTCDEIYEALAIAQISCEDVDSLIRVVTNKFVKK